MKPSRVPLIFAIVRLLLPVLYVGSYLVLVRGERRFEPISSGGLVLGSQNGEWVLYVA